MICINNSTTKHTKTQHRCASVQDIVRSTHFTVIYIYITTYVRVDHDEKEDKGQRRRW